MMFDDKREAIYYIQDILNQGFSIPYYRLKIFFEKEKIKVNSIKLIEEKGRDELTLISIDKINEDDSVDLTLHSDSAINFLPLIYHNKDFLKRFLFGLQSSAIDINEKIFNISEEFNPKNTHFIDWLSSWFGITYGKTISEKAKRKITANAVTLYKIRGTKTYFKKLIKYLVNIDIEIDDNRYSPRNRDKSTKKERAFTIIIKDKISEDLNEEAKIYGIIKSVIEKEKPINTKLFIEYKYRVLQNQKEEKKEEIIKFTHTISKKSEELKIEEIKEDKNSYDDYDY